MSKRDELNALADRVENEPPRYALDEKIEQATNAGAPYPISLPPYTARMDVALRMTAWTLVYLSEIGADGLPMAILTDGTREAKGYCFASPISGESALARALTAAGLRALAMMEADQPPTKGRE